MIHPHEFDSFLRSKLDIDSYFGVPDSVLQPFCRYLVTAYGVSDRHIVGVNEGSCVALSAGRYLSTGRSACVYMQNSGLGNAVNPVLSLISPEVYNIPVLFVIGWRGAPGEKDEPQHIAQGSRTIQMLSLLGLDYAVLDENSSIADITETADHFKSLLACGNSVAFLVRKGAFEAVEYTEVDTGFSLQREQTLEKIISAFPGDVFFGTTGVTSREIFEIRERMGMPHCNDFLSVGSMGHTSSIALGAATGLNRPLRIWCLDGDVAALMHMGAMASIGAINADGYIHVLLNNAEHESVGKIPTIGGQIDFCGIARACGYSNAIKVQTKEELKDVLKEIGNAVSGSVFVEICIASGARKDLGRPTISPAVSRVQFMENI